MEGRDTYTDPMGERVCSMSSLLEFSVEAEARSESDSKERKVDLVEYRKHR